MPPDDNDKDDPGAMRELARYSHLGITFAATILICLFGGQYLDGKLGTEPYLTLFGALFGSVAGFYYIIKELVINQNREEEDKKDD
ncbi:MAG: AtpZ/AtpI family protein [FCB group bacterium]|nr:AtpZ/AtpI family protein [FCB group bacterium]